MLEVFKQLTGLVISLMGLSMVTLPFWLIPVIIYFVRKKQYEKSSYYNITKKPYSIMKRNKGFCGEYLIYKYLSSLEGNKRFLFNCYVPKGDGTTTEIDVILIHNSGIFVFESKNYSGWIFGTETQKTWTQTLPSGKRSHKERFFNPIMQNKTHIKYLKTFIGEVIDCTYHSIIVFSDRCTLKNIKLTSDESKVINRYHVLPTVQSIARSSLNILSADQVDMIYNLLYPLTQVSDVEKAVHIQNIQSKLSPQILENQTVGSILKNETESSLNNSPICSKCDTPMILRKATRGERKGQSFYGCSNYPKCKQIINVDQILKDTESKDISQASN